MATMTATMKSFTKGLKTAIKPMQASLANIEQSLIVTASREDVVEGKRAEKVKLNEEKKQTSLLEKLFGKRDKDGKGGSFLSKHWGKILTAIGALLLLIPKDFYKNIFDPKWWKDNSWEIGGWILGAILVKKAWENIGTIILGSFWAGLMLKQHNAAKAERVAAKKVADEKAKKVADEKAKKVADEKAEKAKKVADEKAEKAEKKAEKAEKKAEKAKKKAELAAAKKATVKAEKIVSSPEPNPKVDTRTWKAVESKTYGNAGGMFTKVARGVGALAKGIIPAIVLKTMYEKGIEAAMVEYLAIVGDFSMFTNNLGDFSMFTNNKDSYANIANGDLGRLEGQSLDFRKKVREVMGFNNKTPKGLEEFAKKVSEEQENKNTKRTLEKIHKLKKELNEGGKQHTERNNSPLNLGSKGGYTSSDLKSGNTPSQGMYFRTFPTANWYDSKSHRIRMNKFGDHPTAGTRETSWSKLNPSTQTKVNFLAERLGQMILTSGWRTQKSNITARINRLDPLGGVGGHVGADGNFIEGSINTRYKRSWRNAILNKFGQPRGSAMLMAGPGTDDRKDAVEFLSTLPDFGGPHGHGNAIDMKYPAGYGKDASGKAAFAKLVGDIFPGSTVYDESGHLHVGFNPKINPEDIKNAWNTAHEERSHLMAQKSFGLYPSTTLVNNSPTNIKQGDNTVLAGSYSAQDNGIWNEQTSSNRWRYS
jgi:flagellar biosynthesis/type III secretory pathway protein FliH